MSSAGQGFVYRKKYDHTPTRRTRDQINKLADRIIAEELAKMNAATSLPSKGEEPRQKVFEFIKKSRHHQENEPMAKMTCPNCGHSDDATAFQKMAKALGEQDAIDKAFHSIMAKHELPPSADLRKRQQMSIDRDRALSELHRTERRYRPLPTV